jgi:hypothetical protein
MLNKKQILGGASALVIAMTAGAASAQVFSGTVDGTAASTTTSTGAPDTVTQSGDQTVSPYQNTITTVVHQSVTATTPTTPVDDTVTVLGTTYDTHIEVSGSGTQLQDSTTSRTDTYDPTPPQSIINTTITPAAVTPVGSATITSVSATGFAGDATSTGLISYGSNLSSGTPVAGVAPATENSVLITTSGATYSTYTGTATFNPTTGDVTVALPTLASQTTVTSAGISTPSLNLQGGVISNVGAGVADTDAVNVGQLNSAIASLSSDVIGVARALKKRAEAGTAVAVALSGGMFLPNHKFNLTANVGTYKGETAIAGQIGFLVNDNVALNAGVATSFHGYGGTAARGGITFGF